MKMAKIESIQFKNEVKKLKATVDSFGKEVHKVEQWNKAVLSRI